MTVEDIDAVAEMERTIFSAPWKKDDFADLINKNDRGCILSEEDGEITGCVVYHNIVGDVDITNVQVKEAFRGHGTGAALMRAAIKKARTIGGERFTLEVRKSNRAAIALYESLGFMTEGIRRNFYEHPTEDALIMWLK
ncbi:MAG: ribosomal protein S18-alanine N-acetyltransferase [Lachnospiraceae bacterium]|nr:ribosomal protein S18-alanine N-acetyltransferase [Lachnospiraceae bacterium]